MALIATHISIVLISSTALILAALFLKRIKLTSTVWKRIEPLKTVLSIWFSLTITIAICISAFDLSYDYIFSERQIERVLWGLVLGSTFFLVYIYLDHWYLPQGSYWKLPWQLIAAVILYLFGIKITFVTVFGKEFIFNSWSLPLTLLWILVLTNIFVPPEEPYSFPLFLFVVALILSYFNINTAREALAPVLLFSLGGILIGVLFIHFFLKIKLTFHDFEFLGFIFSAFTITARVKTANLLIILPIVIIMILWSIYLISQLDYKRYS